MGSPSGNVWLAFMISAILQSDDIVLFVVFSQPEQITDFDLTLITLLALRHSTFCFSSLQGPGHSNQCVLDYSLITDHKQQKSHR